MDSFTVKTPTNIALIKYWGKSNIEYNLPLNSSISLTVDITKFFTQTTVGFLPTNQVQVFLNGREVDVTRRILAVISAVKALASSSLANFGVKIETTNNFPTAAGMASSASGFSALAFSLSKLFSINITTEELSCIARLGSGSASRSMFGGLVEWHRGDTHLESFAEQVFPSDYWPELRLLVIICDSEKKAVSSTEAMQIVTPSLLARAEYIESRIISLKKAFQDRDFNTLASIIIEDSNDLHRVINESGVNYLNKISEEIKDTVELFNNQTKLAAYTFDAGPNAWILIQHQNLADFLILILQKFKLPYDNLKVVNPPEYSYFEELQAQAKISVEEIIESNISESGPIQIS